VLWGLGLGLGVIGSALLSIGGWQLTPQSYGYGSLGAEKVPREFLLMGPPAAMIVGGVLLLVIAWTLCARVKLTLSKAVWTAVAWGAPMLVAPPLLSTDMYAYADQGWQLLHGMNPYVVGLGTDDGPFARLIRAWRGTITAYPPLALWAQALAVLVGGSSVPTTIIALRMISVISVVGMGVGMVMLARHTRIPAGKALWWAVLNPLTMVHLVGGGHNDAPAAAAVTMGLALGTRRFGWLWAGLLIGVAACFKQPAILAAVPAGLVIGRFGHGAREKVHPSRMVLAVVGVSVVAVAAFALIHLISGLGYGWINALAVPGSVRTWAPSSVILMIIGLATGAPLVLPPVWVPGLVLGIVRGLLAIGVLLLVRRWWHRPVLLVAVVLLVAALALDGLRTWYLSWGFGLLVLGAGRRTLGIAAGVISALMIADVLHEHALFDRLGELGVGVAVGILVGVFVIRSLRAVGRSDRTLQPVAAEPLASEPTSDQASST